MEKPIINEVIVVEGRDDTTAIRRAVEADTIETNGSAINGDTIERIRFANEKRGVIILTDPDFPGEKIRKIIDAAVPGCKHAFIKRSEALPKYGRGLGVEHASPDVIREALSAFHTSRVKPEQELNPVSRKRLIEAGLLFGDGARARRDRLGELLRIGYTNGKQLEARLVMFEIGKQEFEDALGVVFQEEKND
ncbi:primase-like protein [Listeria floridensis FSL S10-1187]|uniref:Ribonuclease M5 n=1 Tax=Listeria floridensis FSL S10-1187 TaxID=1265817 RepID=A0ABP3AXC8_9LIST|nr:ribonuclease M5 [Listeria floridensis]EUJ28828.1 primase-like protein [Listeria floridensis FSL S10-1187]